MKGLLLDNWTLEKIVDCLHNDEAPFSLETIALIELIVLWDNLYYIENDFSSYWRDKSVVDGFDIKQLFTPISKGKYEVAFSNAKDEYEKKFSDKYPSVVARKALEYMYISSALDLNYMPFGNRAKFIRDNNLFREFKRCYNRYDAVHVIDEQVMEYYETLNETIRRVDITFDCNILFSAINRSSSSFSDMIRTAKRWSQDPAVKAFKEWVSQLEDDISQFRKLEIIKYRNNLKEIEKNILNSVSEDNLDVTLSFPLSLSIALNFPKASNKSHLIFPMSLYLEGISDDAMIPLPKEDIGFV